ncbi:MAG: multicopper oxidase family protein, partial [Myxococcales bacterium]
EDLNPDPRIVEVNITAAVGEAALLSGAKTAVWTYNDRLPGPLLHARVGDRVIVHFTNNLPESTIIHWHGLRISDQMDGSPRVQDPIEPGESFTYDFVVPDAGTYWYHTHLHQIQQFERGLYGALVVHEAEPPQFTAERIIVVDDIRLDTKNQVGAFLTSGPDIGRGRVGNRLLINGSTKPMKVTLARGAVERWRVVLATNALSLKLRTVGAKTRVIGTDGGFLPAPFDLETVQMAPGQRYDLEVRADDAATEVDLEGLILALDANDNVIEQPFPFVQASVAGEVPVVEPVYPAVPMPGVDMGAKKVNWKLSGGVVGGKVQFTINGVTGVQEGHDHVVLDTFTRGEPVQITLSSSVSPEHPFHLHGQFFQIIKRGGKLVTDEPGLRDTVLVQGAQSVTIQTYFDNPGRWMVHCHIGEHSEMGMMADVEVIDPNAAGGAGGARRVRVDHLDVGHHAHL